MQNIFNKLWDIHTTQNPSAQKVYDLILAEGEQVLNDHSGFIAKSADKIFESTNFYQKK